MTEKQALNRRLAKANEEYRALYCIYKDIIVVVDTLEMQSRKRLRKLSNLDDGLDGNTHLEEKTEKQTSKFTKAIFEFNEKIGGLLKLFKLTARKTFNDFRKLHSSCLDAEDEINCMKDVNKKLRLMNLVIQKFLNKIVHLQEASNIFPNLSIELEKAKSTYESNLKKTIIALRGAITDLNELVSEIDLKHSK